VPEDFGEIMEELPALYEEAERSGRLSRPAPPADRARVSYCADAFGVRVPGMPASHRSDLRRRREAISSHLFTAWSRGEAQALALVAEWLKRWPDASPKALDVIFSALRGRHLGRADSLHARPFGSRRGPQ